MSKKSEERKEAWFRILVLIISGIILCAWRALIIILAVINWFIVVFSGKRNRKIANFSEYWNTTLYEFARYITFVSNQRPFPFASLNKISKVE